MEIYTDRLYLRPVHLSDVPEIYSYSAEKEVGDLAGFKPHESIEETLEISKALYIEKDFMFAITLKDDDLLIGIIGLTDDPKRENPNAKMIGYSLKKEYWGKGIMTEAVLAVLKVTLEKADIITAYCYPSNSRCKSVLSKCGFLYEGTLHACEETYNGKIYDNECYFIKNSFA